MSELIERLRAQGKDAFTKHYSLGMFKLCTEAADRIAELEAALMPFAREANTHGDQIPDQMFIWDYEDNGGRSELRVGDLRKARAALQAKGEK